MTTKVTKKLYKDPAACNAWVRLYYNSGVPTIRSSHNVSSITDNGTGDFTVNFTEPFASATGYIAVASIMANNGTGVTIVPNCYNNGGSVNQATPSASSMRFAA